MVALNSPEGLMLNRLSPQGPPSECRVRVHTYAFPEGRIHMFHQKGLRSAEVWESEPVHTKSPVGGNVILAKAFTFSMQLFSPPNKNLLCTLWGMTNTTNWEIRGLGPQGAPKLAVDTDSDVSVIHWYYMPCTRCINVKVLIMSNSNQIPTFYVLSICHLSKSLLLCEVDPVKNLIL